MALNKGLLLFLKFAAYLVCLVSFMTLAAEQVRQYLEGQTSIAKFYHHDQLQKERKSFAYPKHLVNVGFL